MITPPRGYGPRWCNTAAARLERPDPNAFCPSCDCVLGEDAYALIRCQAFGRLTHFMPCLTQCDQEIRSWDCYDTWFCRPCRCSHGVRVHENADGLTRDDQVEDLMRRLLRLFARSFRAD